MDIFEKCFAPSLAGELKEKGVYPYFHALQSRQDVEVQMEGKRRIMLGSNNYLGLTTDPEVIEAGIRALEQYGTGCSGSRFLNGTLEMHLELEAELARFLRKPGVVTFGTGFQSNVGIISALVGRHDYVICDRENHASIYAGCQLSYGKMLRYRHSDMALTGWACWARAAGARPATSAWRTRWTCTWGPSPSRWRPWAAIWPPARRWRISCGTHRGRSSSRHPSRRPTAPRR